MKLTECSDREIVLMMKESIMRMRGALPISKDAIRALYDEYRSRPMDRRDDENPTALA